jgi:hypothetical protein
MCTPEEEAERLQEELLGFVNEACQAEHGSVQRQRATTRLLRAIMQSNKLWRENVDYYEDALHQTLLYICNNLCEGEKKYDPEKGRVMTWVNRFLRYNLANERRRIFRDLSRREPSRINPETGEFTDPIDDITSCADDDLVVSRALQTTELWVRNDPDRILRSIYIRDRPDVNCRILILRRVFLGQAWQNLSDEFKVSIPALSGFYQNRCIRPLREFGETEGFW